MLQSASSYYRLSALIAARAATQANSAAPRGFDAVATVVATHQVAQATVSQTAVDQMLLEQGIKQPAQARINVTAFTTSTEVLAGMLQATRDDQLNRLVASLVQDAGRAAESVAVTARPHVVHTRYLTPPSCSRCAVLAGRVYRWSDGFQRHPHCDCVMVPTSERAAPELVADPSDLVDQGKVTGLSKADLQAVRHGADLGQVVNVRRSQAGLQQAGQVLARRTRLTPQGIYNAAGDDRDAAVQLLHQYGYLL